MSGPTILPAPPSHRHDDLADWLRMVAKGATQLVQEAACDPDADAALSTATAWLATDLGAICEAAATYIEDGRFELVEDELEDPDRIDEMARLLQVGTAVFGSRSREREFVESDC